MILLIVYVSIALGFSFLCSIAEAVLLSVTPPYVALLEKQGRAAGTLLSRFRNEINEPLSAILTLNTIAHTVGAAGAGAQAAAVFGSNYLGLASAILTLLILIFSEIIPKTLGATYWRQLAPATAHFLRFLIMFMYPFVKLSYLLTRGFSGEHTLVGFSRREFTALAEQGAAEGKLDDRELKILKNLLLLRHTTVQAVMTPRIVMFARPRDETIAEFFENWAASPFSRIPIYSDSPEKLCGFVMRRDLLMAQAEGGADKTLNEFHRKLDAVVNKTPLSRAFELFLENRAHIMMVVDEYGDVKGLVTLEDILETLLGLEIVDELDKTTDMQIKARQLWKKRAEAMGIDWHRVDQES